MSKTFGSRTVLSDFDIELRTGEVHALLGQNGSGKSTFIKILTGYHESDDGGSLSVRGSAIRLPLHPGQPGRLGMAFVHQDLGLVDELSVLENVRVARYSTGFGWRVPWAAERRYVREQLQRFGLDIDPDRAVGSLSEADRAIVAIVRAIERLSHVDRGLLVLDEPTVYLPRDAVQRLFDTVRGVAADGHAVLMVTHRLEEVFDVSNRVTVLRDSRRVAVCDTVETNESDLVEKILGRTLGAMYPEPGAGHDGLALTCRGLTGGRLSSLDFDLHRGEILGVTGLVGMGSEDLPYLLVGAERCVGELEVGGERMDIAEVSPGIALKRGIALLPADRLRRGAVTKATVLENLTLPTLAAFVRHGRLRHGRERDAGRRLLERFDVQPPTTDAPFGTLSGGNQQKTLLAKWFETSPEVFVLHEPTQGVDIGARQQIFAEVEAARERGMAFVIVSVEYDDLAHLCDRVIVVRDGRARAELQGDSLTADRIIEQCYVGGPRGPEIQGGAQQA